MIVSKCCWKWPDRIITAGNGQAVHKVVYRFGSHKNCLWPTKQERKGRLSRVLVGGTLGRSFRTNATTTFYNRNVSRQRTHTIVRLSLPHERRTKHKNSSLTLAHKCENSTAVFCLLKARRDRLPTTMIATRTATACVVCTSRAGTLPGTPRIDTRGIKVRLADACFSCTHRTTFHTPTPL